MTHEDAAVRHARFLHWQDAAPSVPEIIRGLHGAGVLRLDQHGRAEEGWDDLPAGTIRAGGYDEERTIYAGPAFAGLEEPRTVHMAIDVAAPAGTEVFAPLAGIVHSFRDNAAPFDYGPTLILEHAVTAGLTVWSLYGHLSRESLSGLCEGKVFAAGERIATLGASEVNGNWPPHLHFQLILDIGEWRGDFPGVFRKSERDHWRLICPDPRPLLGLTAH